MIRVVASLVLPVFLAANVGAFTPLPLERIQAEPPLAGRAPMQAKLSPNGRYVTFLKPSADDSEVLDLWARPLTDPNAAEVLLVSTSELLGGAEQKLTESERMALERRRIRQRGITSYRWCGADDTTLLFPLSGDLYAVALSKDGKKKVTRLTKDDDVPEQNPVCDVGGAHVAYVKKGNLIVHNLKTNRPKILLKGATSTKTWGLAEFIAEEELSRHDGFWWSKDGKSLLVLQVDESDVGVKVRPQIFADRTEMVSQRYPAAGEKNAVVTPWIVNAKTGAKKRVSLDNDVEYIARAGFFADGTPWLQVLNRSQRQLRLLAINPKTGKPNMLLEETDHAWVEVHDDLHELKDGTIVWSSERSGRRQLERLDRKTGALTTLTAQPESVQSLVCVDDDAQRLVFAGYADRGRSTHLFLRTTDGTITPLTSGARSHSASGDSTCEHLLVGRSAWGEPPVTVLVDVPVDAKRLKGPLERFQVGGTGEDAPDAVLKSAVVAPLRFLDLRAADGTTILNGIYLAPAAGSKAKGKGKGEGKDAGAPVVVYAYGGPTGQVVAHRWQRLTPLFIHWQQQGFGVFLVDTRGMAGRDHAFTRAHKESFGVVEVEDLKAAVRQLPTLVSGVDASRIGFFGWSYGGFLAARLVLDSDTPFAAAASVAPVTDWTLYDTAYTERYLGPPIGVDGKASKSYEQADLVPRAALLSKPLLLMHGTADDNVLFENTLRLVQALEDAGKTFDLAIYPGKAHGIAGKSAQLHVHKTLTRFFVDELKP